MAVIDLSAYFYSMLDTLKSFFFRDHQAHCPHNNSYTPAVDIESAQMQSVDIVAAPSNHGMDQELLEPNFCSSSEQNESEEEEENNEDEEYEDEEEENENGAEGDNFDEGNMDSTSDLEYQEEEKYHDEVIIMSSTTNKSSSESSSEPSEYSSSDDDDETSSSVSSLQLNQSPSKPDGLFSRVLSIFGGAKYPDVDADHTSLIKYSKNEKLNLV